jgi:hypothetical protein
VQVLQTGIIIGSMPKHQFGIPIQFGEIIDVGLISGLRSQYGHWLLMAYILFVPRTKFKQLPA